MKLKKKRRKQARMKEWDNRAIKSERGRKEKKERDYRSTKMNEREYFCHVIFTIKGIFICFGCRDEN